jgi:hypothetical protein
MLLSTAFASVTRIRQLKTLIALLAALNYHTFAVAAPENAPRLEYQIKAGYLFNFLRFTDWPPQALAAGEPYRIGVVSDTAAFPVIAEALNGKILNGREINVLSLQSTDSLQGCHLVFVPRSVTSSTWEALGAEAREGVLLIGESDGYALRSGMIGFVSRGHNIRFQVNLAAAQQAGLKLSGRLASLAEIVRTQPQ